jgi:NhaP-type Na+/H+ and K+/H+ antiporter
MIDEARAAADAAREAAKDPLSYPLLTYLWVFLLSAAGGFVSFMRKVQLGVSRWCNLMEFLGELVTAAFVGVLTFWLCEAAGMSPLLTAALVGVTSHMGTRAIFLIEKMAQRSVERRLGIQMSDESGGKE